MGIALFVIALIALVCSVVAFIGIVVADEEDRFMFAGWGVGLLVLAILCWVLSSITTVPARSSGVPVSFGKVVGDPMEPGLHWKAPWVSVQDIDSSTQIQEYKGDDCITVVIADGSTACISMTYRWSIKEGAADTVYAEYNKAEDDITETVRKALVSTNVKASLNEAFADYNPLNINGTIDSDTTPEELAQITVQVAPDYKAINKEVAGLVEEKITDVGDLIDIKQITVSYVKLSDASKKKIDDFNAAILKTRIALQEKATKAAEAAGIVILNEALKDAPVQVTVSKCLDLMADGLDAPVGFQCWPGTSGAVVVPATK